MQILKLLIVAKLLVQLNLPLSIAGPKRQRFEIGERSGKDKKSVCQCQKYFLSQVSKYHKNRNINSVSWGNINLKVDENQIIGSGGLGFVYHAYWEKRGICMALKVTQMLNSRSDNNRILAENEVKILEYFSNLNENERNYLIYMYGHNEIKENIKIFKLVGLELGGINLFNYFNEILQIYPNKEIGLINYFKQKIGIGNISKLEEILTNMLNCAARALKQFHEHAVHRDIKANNFVLPHGQDLNVPIIFCKLIDFDDSILKGDLQTKHFNYLKSKDVLEFGEMFNDIIRKGNIRINGNGILNRVIKGCFQENSYERPNMNEIIRFLDGECDGFKYESYKLSQNSNLC